MISHGTVVAVRNNVVECRLPGVSVGDSVRVAAKTSSVHGTINALDGSRAFVMLHEAIDGVAAGDEAVVDPFANVLPLGMPLLGRCVNANGDPLDLGPPIRGRLRAVDGAAPLPAQRAPVTHPLWTGVRAIDGLLTIGRGARVGIFGRPGTGKSTLLHMLVQGAEADAVVVALVGERGAEAEEWMRRAPSHASIVCATSDRSAEERIRAARVAIAQAAVLRSHGLHVLVILDSLARYAAALRDVAVSSGQPPGRAGWPPAVFGDIARYVEVAGNARGGSVTLLATVLSDGDERDPISEAARSLLDGHIELNSALAQRGRFPAIDIQASVSRTMQGVVDEDHGEDAAVVRRAVCALSASEDARALGVIPADPFARRAVDEEEPLRMFLCQQSPAVQPGRTLSALAELADRLR
jgi:FliI/YscN family ATPase